MLLRPFAVSILSFSQTHACHTNKLTDKVTVYADFVIK